GRTNDVVKLQPAWINVLQEDSVTLTCQGDHDPGNTTTQWFHNGNFTWTENQPSFSFKARRASSGYYRCQTAYSSLSDPVHLDVISGYLLKSPAILFIFPPWYQITFYLAMGLLFAVDTGLYFSVQRDLQCSKGEWKNSKVRWSQGPQDK
uniref:Ig-like domain-containing protein n=1 Tax=Sus scrofa TaxID=9823 RepID=A0A8W4FGG0_PIG